MKTLNIIGLIIVILIELAVTLTFVLLVSTISFAITFTISTLKVMLNKFYIQRKEL